MNKYQYDIKPLSNSCYSSLEIYGSYGSRPIVPPIPAEMLPEIFKEIKPHDMSSFKRTTTPKQHTCSGYEYIGKHKKCH